MEKRSVSKSKLDPSFWDSVVEDDTVNVWDEGDTVTERELYPE